MYKKDLEKNITILFTILILGIFLIFFDIFNFLNIDIFGILGILLSTLALKKFYYKEFNYYRKDLYITILNITLFTPFFHHIFIKKYLFINSKFITIFNLFEWIFLMVILLFIVDLVAKFFKKIPLKQLHYFLISYILGILFPSFLIILFKIFLNYSGGNYFNITVLIFITIVSISTTPLFKIFIKKISNFSFVFNYYI